MITIEDSLRFKLDFEQEKSKNLFEELMEYKNKVEQLEAALASQAQQEPAKAKHHPICDRRYPSLCDACNAEAKEESQAQQPCDMNELCLDCQPRGKNGECPDQLPPAPEGDKE